MAPRGSQSPAPQEFPRDLLLTGLPRAGLSVSCMLIDGLPNAACLNEPEWQVRQLRLHEAPVRYGKWLVGDFAWMRAKFMRQEEGEDVDGAKPVPRREGLKPNFLLGMKHPLLYTALLPSLVDFRHFNIVAVIRHPAEVLTSWQACDDEALREGKISIAKRFWPEAERISESKLEPLERMMQLYEAYLERYHAQRKHIHILRYEDIIKDPMAISRACGKRKLSAAAKTLTPSTIIRSAEQYEKIVKLFKHSVFAKIYYKDIA